MERIDENQTQEEQSYGRSYKRHFHHKRNPASARRKTMIFGFLVVVFGTTWLLENLGVISKDISRVIISWPSVLIAVGLINLVNGMGRFFGVILILAGAFWHSTLYFEYNFNFHEVFWPSLIIIVGLAILFGSRKMFKKRRTVLTASDGIIEEVAVFGGHEKKLFTKNFKGGEIVAIFGGSEIDLTMCEMEPGKQAEIEMVAVFGGTKLIVPRDWNVVTEVVNVFGGFSDKRYLDAVDESKTLLIKGVAVFGGGELSNR